MSRNTLTNYLKAAYSCESADANVTPSAVAARLGVSVSTASTMLGRLAEKGYLQHLGRGRSRLTRRGRAAAERVVRKHRLAETFLYRVLGYPLEDLHEEAMLLEGVMSDRLEAALDELLGRPERDPHGHRIPRGGRPTRQLSAKTAARSLVSAKPGERVRVVEIDDSTKEGVKCLRELGLLPGSTVTMEGRDPFGGPIWISQGKQRSGLGWGLASKVWVESVDASS